MCTGWAFVNDGKLFDCGVGESWPCADLAVIERPQVYTPGQSKGNPNDLITLAIRVGRYVERLARVGIRSELVLPNEWKGTINKDRHHARVRRNMPASELKLAKERLSGLSDSIAHNAWDAVALAYWFSRKQTHKVR